MSRPISVQVTVTNGNLAMIWTLYFRPILSSWMSKLRFYICIIGLPFVFSIRPFSRFSITAWRSCRHLATQHHPHILLQSLELSWRPRLQVTRHLRHQATQAHHRIFPSPHQQMCSHRCPLTLPSTCRRHIRHFRRLPMHPPFLSQHKCIPRHHKSSTTSQRVSSPPHPQFHQR